MAKSKSNENLSKEWDKKKDKGRNVPHAVLSQYTKCVCSVFSSLSPYGSITISLIHGYGLAVSASKIMFA